MKYADIIQLQKYFHPVFQLEREVKDYWKQFIPTPQFYKLLGTVLDAVTGATPSKRKSLWIQGTFGTGKSHAGSVIRHLLCDDTAEINGYILDHLESENAELTARLRALRNGTDGNGSGKKFFPVVLCGVQGAHSARTFSLTLERAIKDALRAANIQITVKSDFEGAIEWLNNNEHIFNFDKVLPHAPELRARARTRADVINKLGNNDMETFLALEETVAKYGVALAPVRLTDWLSQVETELRKQDIADGLFIFWDEFTSVMDTISSGITNNIQNIAELAEKQNIFLYLISHRLPSAYSGGERNEDVRKMSDRFHLISYRMEPNTTYRLMAATMKKTEPEYSKIRSQRETNDSAPLVSYLADDASAVAQNDIKNLFPLHPYTAFLCSAISGQIGSSNRSVFKFLYDENGFVGFLNNTAAADGNLLTSDTLWDFFREEFSDDKFGAINGTYITHIETLNSQGADFVRVFKGVLLLNALRNVFEKEQVTPSQQNILRLFLGEISSDKTEEILEFLNQKQIVPKDPLGNFLIANSALPPMEIEKERANQRGQFSDVARILDSSDGAASEIRRLFNPSLLRENEIEFIPCSIDEARLKSILNQSFKKSYTLRLALFLAKDKNEKERASSLLPTFASEFRDVIFIVFDEVLDDNGIQYERFITYMATATVAGRHSDNEQQRANKENATRLVTNWASRIRNGTYTLHFRGTQQSPAAASGVAKFINDQIGHYIFTRGADALATLRNKPEAFWKTKASKKVAEVIVAAKTRDEVVLKLPGAEKPADYLLKDEDGDSYIVNSELELSDTAPGTQPLVAVKKEVERLLKNARQRHIATFNLGEILAPLAQPPFGLYKNSPNYFLLGFALRPYLSELYDAELGRPLTPDLLRDKIDGIFSFWENRTGESKLRVRFGSKEEKKLLDFCVEAFHLQTIAGGMELSSIKNVRWGIQQFCKTKSKRPLWALKHCTDVSEEIKDVLEQFTTLLKNPETQQEHIAKLLRSVEPVYYEFRALLDKEGAFEDGFQKFVKATDNVQFEEVWWQKFDEELRQTLNEEIGLWTESDVRQRVMSFYIKQLKPTEPPQSELPKTISPPPQHAFAYPPLAAQSSPTLNEPPAPDRIARAKQKIDTADADELRAMLHRILELPGVMERI